MRVARLNPILVKKEEAAQKAARESGFTDYVALSEELRAVKLDDLLVQGVAYVHTTDDAGLNKMRLRRGGQVCAA